MTLTTEEMVISKRRNQLRKQLAKQRAWLKKPPYHLGITKADIAFEKKIYEKLYRELDDLEWYENYGHEN